MTTESNHSDLRLMHHSAGQRLLLLIIIGLAMLPFTLLFIW